MGKNTKQQNTKQLPFLTLCMCVALVLTGGFFDSSVAWIGLVVIASLFIMLMKGESFYKRDKRKIFWVPMAVFVLAAAVSIWAVDYMENFMGVMRIAVICLWMYLVRSSEEKELQSVKRLLPLMGCLTILLCLVSLLIPSWKVYFWENSRMSGFFQYANTNGLFYAVGILLLLLQIKEQKETKEKIKSLIQIVLLLVGVLLSGSRSVLLFLVLWCVYYAIRVAEYRKPILFAGAGLFLCGAAYVTITQNTANIGRIFTIFTSNSTLWGRLLYYRDALLFLCHKWFGLGRLGYYYTQGTFQSGVYHIKFVHNDFLQIALDYGVIALVLILLFLGWQIVKGKQDRGNKEILLFICMASLVDFHLQYLFILMLACLFLDYGETEKEKKAQMKENYVLLPLVFAILLYIGIATESSRLGNIGLTLSMLPDYTSAQETVALHYMGSVQSYEISTRLIEKNPYNLSAYIARGSFYASQLYVEECIADLDRMLELDPYKAENYQQYELMLENMESVLVELEADAETEEKLRLLRERKETLAQQLAEVEDRTSALAYKIKDLPVFTYE